MKVSFVVFLFFLLTSKAGFAAEMSSDVQVRSLAQVHSRLNLGNYQSLLTTQGRLELEFAQMTNPELANHHSLRDLHEVSLGRHLRIDQAPDSVFDGDSLSADFKQNSWFTPTFVEFRWKK